jgi:hypothetical protein
MTKRTRFLAIAGAAIVVIGLTISLCGWTSLALLGYVINSVRSAGNPTGSPSVEVRSDPRRADDGQYRPRRALTGHYATSSHAKWRT